MSHAQEIVVQVNDKLENENDIVFSSSDDLVSCVSSSASDQESVIYTTSIVQSPIDTSPNTPTDLMANCDQILPNYNEAIKSKNNLHKVQNEFPKNNNETRPTKKIVKALSEKLLKNKANQQTVTMPGGSALPLTNENNGTSPSAIIHDNSVSDPMDKSEEFRNVSTGILTAPTQESSVTTSLTTQETTDMSHRLGGASTVVEVDPVTLHMSVSHNSCFPEVLVPNMHHLASLQSTTHSVPEPQNTTPMRQNSYPSTTNTYYNHNNNYMYQTSPLENQIPDRDMMLERFIQQQQFYQEQHHVQTPAHPQTYPYAMNMKENYTMKSPDSGYHEPCLSPTEQHNAMVCKDFLFYLIIYLVEVYI